MKSPSVERETSIATLIEQTRSNPEAFGDIYRLCRPQVLSQVRLHNIRGPDAEDIAQNVFMRAFRYFPGFRGRTGNSLSGWLRSLTTSAVSDYFRSTKRRFKEPIEVISLDRYQNLEDPTPIFEIIPDSSRPLEEQFLIKERIERVGENIKVLPPLTQMVLVLTGWEYSQREIMEKCGIPLCAVKRRLHRGRTRLQKLAQLR